MMINANRDRGVYIPGNDAATRAHALDYTGFCVWLTRCARVSFPRRTTTNSKYPFIGCFDTMKGRTCRKSAIKWAHSESSTPHHNVRHGIVIQFVCRYDCACVCVYVICAFSVMSSKHEMYATASRDADDGGGVTMNFCGSASCYVNMRAYAAKRHSAAVVTLTEYTSVTRPLPYRRTTLCASQLRDHTLRGTQFMISYQSAAKWPITCSPYAWVVCECVQITPFRVHYAAH